MMKQENTRDFVHNAALQFDPTDLSRTNIALFFTRWITHFCAPVFVFLAGTGAYLQLARGKSKTQLSRFLVTRGLWLIFLELTVVKLGVFFNPDIRFLGFLQVIWVIGFSMIVIAAFGLLMITLHNLLDTIRVEGWHGPGSPAPPVIEKLWILLHQAFYAFPIAGWPSPVIAVI